MAHVRGYISFDNGLKLSCFFKEKNSYIETVTLIFDGQTPLQLPFYLHETQAVFQMKAEPKKNL